MPEDVDVSKGSQNGKSGTDGQSTKEKSVPGDSDVDDFGLPVRRRAAAPTFQRETDGDTETSTNEVAEHTEHPEQTPAAPQKQPETAIPIRPRSKDDDESDNDEFKDAQSSPPPEIAASPQTDEKIPHAEQEQNEDAREITLTTENVKDQIEQKKQEDMKSSDSPTSPTSPGHRRAQSSKNAGISEWSHQRSIAHPDEEDNKDDDDEWQPMPAYAPYDIYDDDNKLIAREAQESDDEAATYGGLGGAGKGYTRVQLDEDAQSATSMDENTQYLFKEANGDTAAGFEEEQRDAVSQMEATKDLLTEGQRIAYVGLTRLALSAMVKQVESLESLSADKRTKKVAAIASEAMQMWSQKMMVRLYAHMEISEAEQIMIEQLSEHGVEPGDLTPTLMQNARVKNPMAETESSVTSLGSPRPESLSPPEKSPRGSISSSVQDEESAAPPPPYVEHEGEDLPEVRTPSQLPTTQKIDIDLRWTVLCDLFLVLIADSTYDSRSRTLLEIVGEHLSVPWLDICRFEKRVTDALEMQQAAEKENWNEDEHKENRRKLALKKRYLMMGLATVGGGLVIGLSAGLLAPVIGAGLAAGFTTIGVAGTGSFLAGAGGAAIITTTAATTGGIIGVKAANRRTGAVKTFEYRPLHNNKRVNLIVTVSGWMTGKVDDVRLPYSTVDPIMGDIYSVLWEPEMLSSMGDTINILATEALTQGLQQVLGSTILIGLMAALQLPVVLTKLSYLIDNPWTVSLDRAAAAGLILADSLIDRNLGSRPITFVGYSLGSRVIYSCLRELARKGAFGLVQNVYLFGSPIVANKNEYIKVRSVVSGRFVNGYARNDWILGYLFRLTSGGISRVAGLAPVEGVIGLENVDVTELVPGHMAYRALMPRLLREVGWAVESDEFTEIEDPDPENHEKRQRELINELEEARREYENEGKSKSRFGFFARKKKAAAERKEWETYQEQANDEKDGSETRDSHDAVLFDVDAIRAELAKERMEIRELESTLPPMKLEFNSSPVQPRSSLRETKSYDESSALPRSATVPEINHPQMQDEIEMTFDTSFTEPPIRRSPSAAPSPSPSPALGGGPPLAEPTDRAATLQRPELKSSYTLPAINLDHNAWADDEDEFREKEMEMTFA